MKLCIQNMNVRDKRVILRVDYNVPFSDGVILDDSKIRASIKTIRYLLKENCKIILLSHFGKIRNNYDKQVYSLSIVAERLKQILNHEVYFSKVNFGDDVIKRVQVMQPGEILMLENTRFMDLPNKLESKCDAQLAMFWASLGDVFVNDAFATMHRRHASTYGIAMYLPSCIGFLVQEEVNALDKYIMHPEMPFTLVMGGAKMDDKITLIEALLPKCTHVLCGGGIANTCLKALGFRIGNSIASDNPVIIKKVQELLLKNKEKFLVPLDAIVGSTYDKDYVQYRRIDKIDDNEIICDIGVKTLERYSQVIRDSKTVFLNGTVGLYEDMRFANGTKEILKALANSSATVVVGGGDASSSVHRLGYGDMFTYISSGGGATLEYLAKGTLVCLDIIQEEGSSIEILDM